MLGSRIHWDSARPPFANLAAAVDWFEEYTDKGDGAQAVQYKENDDIHWMVGGLCSV